MSGEGAESQTKLKEGTSSDVFSEGIFQLLKPIVTECESKMQNVYRSQNELTEQIETLSKELDKFVETSQTSSLIFQQPMQSLQQSKQRLNNINRILGDVRDRLDRMEKIAANDGSTSTPLSNVFSSFFRSSSSSILSPSPQATTPLQSSAASDRPSNP
ncbi:hypothetical protein PROFUN_06057 [Planoprotostelium fungivorum]|uniref:Biogenesis of lysosome-related organelles complex 1 subunit 7 n=1 Tax=Planoprotostelium fungivorum TaxID=1890364 RepID=A0A2P6NPQ6_9EUKA|nr:hypothetical protein PROFUN_06057 [Planoprotostelium fungivorum]